MNAHKQRIWGSLDPFLESGPVWGRKVANEQFLKALLALDPFDAYHFFLSTPKEIQAFKKELQKYWPGLAADKRLKVLPRQELPHALRQHPYYCFHLSDCINHPPALARLRNACSQEIFPITSITHSLSYPHYTARFLDHLWPGCTPRDCIVSTSRAGKTALETSFQILGDRFGLDKERYPRPRLEIIPLGMHEPFPWDAREMLRQKGREKLQADPEQCVMLILGRISPHSKMDMLPLLRAWQRTFPRKNTKTLLVVAGWVEQKDDFPGKFQHFAANVGLPCRIVPRPDEQTKQELYAAADLFISLADNPQETFGLTLLEAALAGLPVIASDYSGYRDLVKHEQTGLLIPTIGPKDSEGIDWLAGLIPDYEVQFLLAQQTATHIPALTEALQMLCLHPEMRRAMGEKARQRALTDFSWPIIIQDYLALWQRLRDLDILHPAHAAPRPLELSYARMFSSLPRSPLDFDAHLQVTTAGDKVMRGKDFPVIYAGLEHLVAMDILKPLLFFARKQETVAGLRRKLAAVEPGHDLNRVDFCIHWAVKHDLLQIVDH